MSNMFKQGFMNTFFYIFKRKGKESCSYCGSSTKESKPCYYCNLGVCKWCGFLLDDLPVHVQCATMIWFPENVLIGEKVKELSEKYIRGMKK